MRQFYLLFSKRDAVRLKSDKTNRDAMSPDSMEIGKTHSLRGELSWTHYRQISTLYYERLLASREKELKRERRLIEEKHSIEDS